MIKLLSKRGECQNMKIIHIKDCKTYVPINVKEPNLFLACLVKSRQKKKMKYESGKVGTISNEDK
jgi:hypothetical protein